MHSIFNKKKHTFLRFRLFFYITISLMIIISDIRYNILVKIQNYIDYPSFFLHFLSNIPNQWLQTISQSLKNNQELLSKNNILQQELSYKNSELLLMEHYKQENIKLRELLSSPLLYNEKKILTQVISTKINQYTSQIIIDKGIRHGVYVGQPVINHKGIIGQVIATNDITSRVLLICDTSHAVPVQILRNNTRMILNGNGYKKTMDIKHFPNNSDIQIGDILITSGIGGRFPAGYPVATVSSIVVDKKTGYTVAQAYPIVQLDNLSYLLLLCWNITDSTKSNVPLNKTHKIFINK
ncbi:rod shape-determining protein MreC [Blochmannia endosymbiont of Polyrhachis (Hedomyrma) turneri]|uniref:rod shape-determining protein MreC n=1 Tax=Blochmannia endosymbiont of Polyrhachis (Hedomyrma) turneri TaxID=1505596 RepID=UPI00061A61CA|nr:rod shape-determining protein MreC [Blochmannia endosymbiont of Polyrhachis (Hedomyrma) turneri]AKC59843.1 Rod shape-determining protein mreC [Blochmannia endosymbiont of Polyrhachis (Hedomyrma) turneri]